MKAILQTNKSKYPYHYEMHNFVGDADERRNYIMNTHSFLQDEYKAFCEEYEVRVLELGGDKEIHCSKSK